MERCGWSWVYAVRYDEVRIECKRASDGTWVAVEDQTIVPKALGWKRATDRHGHRYVSGVRAEESGDRMRRMKRFGVASQNTCAPIGWWSGNKVFAYLWANDLPVHPAYAMTLGGRLDRRRIRVAAIGGEHGTGHGRAEWEQHYYHQKGNHDYPLP